MKRFLLITAGTVGSLGAVLSITPPQLGNSDLGLTSSAGNSTSTGSSSTTANTTSNSSTSTNTATPVTTPTIKSASGTFTGPAVDVSYGMVQVEITVSNGKITNARALQSPSGRSDRYSSYAIPILTQQTLAAQSTNIQGASGASYTTYGWRQSLQGAMASAGL
jgi:uncharacterized protein with FMN-binding domain